MLVWQLLFPTVTSEEEALRTLALAHKLGREGTTILLDNCDNQFSGSPDKAWERANDRLRELAALADTVITMTDGKTLRVRQSPQEILERIVGFKQKIYTGNLEAHR